MFVQWEAPQERDEAVPDRPHPRRRRPGHRLARHARRPPGLGDVPRPAGLCRLRRRPARPRPRAVPPGGARPAGGLFPYRAVSALFTISADGRWRTRPRTSTPSGPEAATRTTRSVRAVRRRDGADARGLARCARAGAGTWRRPPRRDRPGDPDHELRRRPDGLADRRRASRRSSRRSSPLEPIGPPFLDNPAVGLSLDWGLTAAPMTFDPRRPTRRTTSGAGPRRAGRSSRARRDPDRARRGGGVVASPSRAPRSRRSSSRRAATSIGSFSPITESTATGT